MPRLSQPLVSDLSSPLRATSTYAALWLLAVLGCVSSVAAAARDTGIDAVVVLDSSGSMKHTDPRSLRIPAAKLFLSLLGPKDRAAVISFSDRAYPLIALTPAQGAQQASLLAAVDRVSSRGAHTNLHDAIAGAHTLLTQTPSPAKRRYIILMSDGKMDVGDAARDEQLKRRIQDELMPALTRDGIQVYSLAFTAASDVALLERVALDSRGRFHLAETDRQLHEVFTSMFESAKTPDMLTVEGGEFVTDGSVQEVNIVAPKESAKVRIYLKSPDGARHAVDKHLPDMRWFASERFDMITVPKPVAGTWKILFSEGDNKAYVVTDLRVVTNVDDRDLPADTDVAVKAWLERGEDRVGQADLVASTEFLIEIVQPDGGKARYSLFDNGREPDDVAGDGVYSGTVQFYKEGAHELSIIAQGKTFQRQTKRFFRVQPRPAIPEASPVEPETTTEPEPEPESAPDADAEPVVDSVPAAPSASGSVSLWLVLGVFLMINLVLGGIVAAVLWWRRKQAGRALPGGDDAAE